MTNIQTHTTELDHLANSIKAKLTKSDNMYISAGQEMLKAQELCKADKISFEAWLKLNDIKRAKAYVCLAIAKGKTTVDEVRAESAARVKKSKDNLKAKAAKADAADPSEDSDEDEGITAEHRAMIRALTKFIGTASPATLTKMCKAFKITI